MERILSPKEISKLHQLKRLGKTIVLAGGCFDVIHPGHIVFLQKAKQAGDILIVLLESDQKVKKIKGGNRPIHSQAERALVLSSLSAVDYILKLPFMDTPIRYDRLIEQINPDVIAATAGHPNSAHHQRSAKKIGAKLKFVTKKVGNYSSSRIVGTKK